ncbi:hypothetical protein RV08_GL000681 [Enterococcus mundtii]|nr:hypothetical protein RV08_GL000681 [Enterococcus mundtii]
MCKRLLGEYNCLLNVYTSEKTKKVREREILELFQGINV